MNKWEPITLIDLSNQIQQTETDLNGELWNFWQLIKVEPIKWAEKTFGSKGCGFWIVAICGMKVIWYNDIEEGFNVSDYKNWEEINGYYCNQYRLHWAVIRLFDLIKSSGSPLMISL